MAASPFSAERLPSRICLDESDKSCDANSKPMPPLALAVG